MQPSTQFLHGLTASQTAWIQLRLLEVIRSVRPGSSTPETVLARVKETLESRVNEDTARELLSHAKRGRRRTTGSRRYRCCVARKESRKPSSGALMNDRDMA
jgi:hypothetical protein